MFTWFARKIAKPDTPISDEDRVYSQWLLESSRQAALDDFRGTAKATEAEEEIPPRLFYEPIAYNSY